MGSKKKKAKASTAKSAYSGITNYNVSLEGIGGAQSKKSGKSLYTNSFLAPDLQTALGNVNQGLASSYAYYNQTPEERVRSIETNPYYSLLSENLKRESEQARGELQSSFSERGLQNSTTFGGYLGQLEADRNLSSLRNKLSTLEYMDNKTAADIATLSAGLGQFSNLQAFPLSTAGQQLQTGFGSLDQMAQFNAQQKQRASEINAQLAQQAAQQRSAMIGNLIGAGISAAAIPFTGGLSAMGGLSKLGGLAGGLGRSTGGSLSLGGGLNGLGFASPMVSSNPFIRTAF